MILSHGYTVGQLLMRGLSRHLTSICEGCLLGTSPPKIDDLVSNTQCLLSPTQCLFEPYTPLVSVLFCSSIPNFCSFKKMVLRSCSSTFFVITFYVLNNFFTQYKHTYGQIWASHGSHMKVAHTVLYMKKHTQTYASYPSMDISCMSVV